MVRKGDQIEGCQGASAKHCTLHCWMNIYVFPVSAAPQGTATQVTPALLMPGTACRALSEIMHDVKEAQEAITEVLDDEKALAGICLSEKEPDEALPEGRQPPSVRLAAALLSSYERQIQSVEGALRVCAL